MTTPCPRCGYRVSDGMNFCTYCGTKVVGPEAGQHQAFQPPPAYYPQYNMQPFPFPYLSPELMEARSKRSAAGAGCVLMMVTGGLALLIVPFMLMGGTSIGLVSGLILLAGAATSISGGVLALRGITPFMTVAGPCLMVLGAVLFLPDSFFFVVPVLVGIALAIGSLILVLYGWSDLRNRTLARARGVRRF